MVDHAGGDDFRRRIDHAADNVSDVDFGREHAAGVDGFNDTAVELAAVLLEIPPRNPVLQRHQHRLRAEQLPQGVDHRRDLMRLERQYDDVLRPGIGHVLCRARVRDDLLGPVFVDELQAVSLDRFEMGAARDQRHIVSCEREPDAEKTADGAGADDADFHAAWSPDVS